MKRRCLGVVAAMPQETAPLLKRLPAYRKECAEGLPLYRFRCRDAEVVLVESGMGEARARAATRSLIRIARPDVVFNFGFGGGVAPGLDVGDLVLAERTFVLSGGLPVAAPPPDPELVALLQGAPCGPVKTGSFVTVSGIVNKKALLPALGGVAHPVLEMESAAVTGEAREAGIPAAALRAISDAAGEELGFSIQAFCDAEMRIDPLRVALSIMKKPQLVPQLVRLAGNTRRAGVLLAEGVVRALEALAGKGVEG